MPLTPTSAHITAHENQQANTLSKLSTPDETAEHSKGNWELRVCAETPTIIANGKEGIASTIAGNVPNAHLLLLAQTAPHDCGDPECPGVINKRKLELYDKFQVAIHEFEQKGLLKCEPNKKWTPETQRAWEAELAQMGDNPEFR